jgi:prepilin-type N-terminal cleavage/methylation domain-containing protein
MKIADLRHLLVRGKIRMKKEAGFTLVEIAIVLVVIGLLLGAILAGQEVILNGQIRNTVNEYNNVASAVFVYQDRYRQIPGDDTAAATRWAAQNAVSPAGATAGNRVINGTWNTGTNAEETGIFWHHLRNDELVAGPRSGALPASFALPRNAFEGLIGVQENPPALAMTDRVICQSNIPEKAALIIDSRIDDDAGDGQGSGTGSVRGVLGTVVGGAAANNYNAAGSYTLCRELG